MLHISHRVTITHARFPFTPNWMTNFTSSRIYFYTVFECLLDWPATTGFAIHYEKIVYFKCTKEKKMFNLSIIKQNWLAIIILIVFYNIENHMRFIVK